jgi:DNA excision repair protein ERCC-6-like 2
MAGFFKSQVEEANQQALESGDLYRPVAESTDTSMELEWGPVLILAPSSVLDAWVTAFKVWGYFSVALYQKDARKDILENIKLGSVEILVAGHSRIQSDESATALCKIPWKLVIIDEFHKMKNVNSCLSKNLRSLRDAHDSILLGLTGTMMQNDHKELWNQFDIISKGFLGRWEDFRDKISKPIMISRLDLHDVHDSQLCSAIVTHAMVYFFTICRTKDANPHAVEMGNTKSEELSSRMYEIYLVRKKEVVLKDKLPEKDERIVFCELSPLQKKIYKHVLKQPDFQLLKQFYHPCDCGVNQKFFQDLQQLSSLEERIDYQRQNKRKVEKKGKCCYVVPETYRGSGEIDPRAVIWRRQHEDDMACKMCPSCVCLPAMTILCTFIYFLAFGSLVYIIWLTSHRTCFSLQAN